MGVFERIKDEDIYSDDMPEVIREYLRDDTVSDEEIMRYWKRAVNYIEGYTGSHGGELEGESAPVACMLAIIADMHDNRSFQGERTYINELMNSMLFMYRQNFL